MFRLNNLLKKEYYRIGNRCVHFPKPETLWYAIVYYTVNIIKSILITPIETVDDTFADKVKTIEK